jgi:predicted GIY-YIG superfamily endonuclease
MLTTDAGVYVLHFDAPICPTRYYVDEHGVGHGHTTQHYVGWSRNVAERIDAHRNGRGARLTQVARERGIGFTVVRVFEDVPQSFERELKRQKNTPRLCPTCAPESVARWTAMHADYVETLTSER